MHRSPRFRCGFKSGTTGAGSVILGVRLFTLMRTLSILAVVMFGSLGCERNDPMRVTIHDPQLAAASAQARSEINNFLTAMHSPTANQSNFMICAEFSSGTVPEYLWVGYLQYRDGGFTGRIVTPPKPATGLTNGQRVQVGLSNVTDWAYLENGKLIGGFTSRLLGNWMSHGVVLCFGKCFFIKVIHRLTRPVQTTV